MESGRNKKRLFNACSLALVVTAFTFAVRANLLGALGTEFGLSPKEMGEVASAAFWGFTIAMLSGGLLCDFLGIGKMYMVAFVAHLSGIVFTIYATGYWSLFFSTLLIGLGNGFVESASYTMVNSLYPTEKAKKINDWHIWFPAGIVIGGVLTYLLSLLSVSWRWQMLSILLPTAVYGIMFFRQIFPKSERILMGVSNPDMFRECLRPLFLFMIFCMLLTGATELGTNQWIAELLSQVGAPSILLLVFINGIMAAGRYNAGNILKRLSTTGLLFSSAIFAFVGLIMLSIVHGYAAFLAAGIFATGICFFWPTMIGFVSENLPRTGPLGLSLMGAAGLLSTSIILPFLGGIYQNQLVKAIPYPLNLKNIVHSAVGSKNEQILSHAKLTAGANTLFYIALLPAILIVCFGILHFKKNFSPVKLKTGDLNILK